MQMMRKFHTVFIAQLTRNKYDTITTYAMIHMADAVSSISDPTTPLLTRCSL